MKGENPVIMVRRLLLMLALLAVALAAPHAHAQTGEGPAAAPPAPAEAEIVPTFPQPADRPASLLAPAPPFVPPPADLDRPYFQPDPLLDPPALGPIGWFADVDVGILKPHLINELSLPVNFTGTTPIAGNVPGIPPGVTTGSPPMPSAPFSVTVGVNPSRLNWTVSPRFDVGYRLPSGFGCIALSYRFLTAQGSEGVIGADGPATLSSRLIYNIGDLDWVSNEYTPWKVCEMRWRLGLRYFNAYFDSRADEPFAEAAAGSMVFSQRTTNSVWALGPHMALDLRRRLGFWGLAVVGFFELSEGWGRVRQNYFAAVTTGPSGLPETAVQSISSSDAVPILTTRLGLNWQSPTYPNLRFFAGYQLDYFWNTGRMGSFTTFGYFFDSGILLRGEWNF